MAAKCFTRAAELGDGDGLLDLGFCYEKGIGVTRNVVLARQWYEKGQAAGDKDARKRVKSLGH